MFKSKKVDAYLNFAHGSQNHLKITNDLINPALPPKLHKSLTNLKVTSSSNGSSNGTAGATSSTITAAAAAASSTSSFSSSAQQPTTTSSTMNNLNHRNYQMGSNSTSFTTNNIGINTSHHSSSSSSGNSSATTAVQTIYTLSKPSNSSSAYMALSSTSNHHHQTHHSRSKDSQQHHNSHDQQSQQTHLMQKIQPPSLTLPLSNSTVANGSGAYSNNSNSSLSSSSKINSSTFYPLQNNVTYTLPKNIGGKVSLNSTINSVVSKVPSVISLPAGSSNHSGDNSNNEHLGTMNIYSSGATIAATTTITSKSTTLPKILRTSKKDLQKYNQNFSPSSNTASSTSTSNFTVSQCSMPAYPKVQQQQQQYSSNSVSQQHATQNQAQPATAQTQPNINNMQTQTITSTLAANYCPEDYHLQPSLSNHNHNSNNHNKSSSTSSHSPSTNSQGHHQSNSTANATNITPTSKQLPVCTTSKNCLNPKEHFLPNDTSLDDDYLSECENCKIAQSSKYYLDAEAMSSGCPQETMTLQRKSLEECKDDGETTGYYRISHTLPSNSKKNGPLKSNNREQWFTTIPAASSSSEEDANE